MLKLISAIYICERSFVTSEVKSDAIPRLSASSRILLPFKH
jgi:hypothetical protein